MGIRKTSCFLVVIMSLIAITFFFRPKQSNLPLIAIANLGPHSSLEAAIQGMKDELTNHGFIDQQNIRYEIVNAGFDTSLIPQMISNIKSHHPKVLVVMTTPIAQYAKNVIKDIPLVYSAITNPVASGLLKNAHHSEDNITGSSDKQNLKLVLTFAKQVLNAPSRVGILYSTAEANDNALVTMMKQAARQSGMTVTAIPIDQSRDIPVAMQAFYKTVDFIYVGGSGAIQPALPIIASESNKMGIPVFNLDEAAVQDNMVLASFGVNYHQVGMNTGKLIVSVLEGQSIASIAPNNPSLKDYQGFVSLKNATQLGLHLPKNLPKTTIVR